MTKDSFIAASDIGGTFTDTVVADAAGVVRRYKALTTPEDLVEGVVATFELAARDRDLALGDFVSSLSMFSHGTTVATNALIERRGACTGLLQTAGFSDTLFIQRGYKGFGLAEAELKNFRTLVKRPPVIPRERVREIPERVDYQGRILLTLDEAATRAAIRDLVDNHGVDSIAVSLLWCTKHPAHERRVAELIAEEAPGVHVSTSSEVLARVNEYGRTVTTAVNAFLGPRVKRVTAGIGSRLGDLGLATPPLLMQSNGGVASVRRAGERPVAFLLSGPVGGVVGSAFMARAIGERNVVTTDMGGTSFDVGLVVDGQPLLQASSFVDGQPIGVPTIAVETVGAGGGSIARLEAGALRVGPTSAGSVPGPACYGAGGTQPTVTDADVVLGLINPDTFLAGRQALDRGAAERAIRTHIAEPLGMSAEAAAEGIKRIVDARMSDLIRQVTVHRGHDPRNFALIAFGGAGPVHAYSYGADLGVKKIVIPVTASVHSAFGILTSDLVVTQERSHSFLTPPGSSGASSFVDSARPNELIGELEREAMAMLADQGLTSADVTVQRFVDMHFRFQIHELPVPIPDEEITGETLDLLVERFIAQYERLFGEGSAFTAAGVEFVTWRVVATGHLERPDLHTPRQVGAAKPIRTDRIYSGGWIDAAIFDERALSPGNDIEGPAVIELPDTNIVIGPAQEGGVNERGDLVIIPRG